jgi:hypothetical protein
VDKGDAFRGARVAEAADLARKAQNIKIPGNEKGELIAEYLIHQPTGKFGDLHIVPKSQSVHEGGSPAFRKDRIDLSFVRRIKTFDKTGGKLLIGCVKHIVFGDSGARLTRQKCEQFFDDPKNFVP